MRRIRWGHLLWFFCFSALLYPALYLIGLSSVLDGKLLYVPAALVFTSLIGFIIYPAYLTFVLYKSGHLKSAIGVAMLGVFCPVASGMLLILMIELLNFFPKIKEKGVAH